MSTVGVGMMKTCSGVTSRFDRHVIPLDLVWVRYAGDADNAPPQPVLIEGELWTALRLNQHSSYNGTATLVVVLGSNPLHHLSVDGVYPVSCSPYRTSANVRLLALVQFACVLLWSIDEVKAWKHEVPRRIELELTTLDLAGVRRNSS